MRQVPRYTITSTILQTPCFPYFILQRLSNNNIALNQSQNYLPILLLKTYADEYHFLQSIN
ncbi:MAG: hypothetical protein ABI597_12785 [Gammaproteobacteria bacterium]